MLTAIIDHIKTSTGIQEVYGKFDGVTPPSSKPYIYVWESPNLVGESNRGTAGYYVSYLR